MKSKLIKYPYNRPQYEWNKKELKDYFATYGEKYETTKNTVNGYYEIKSGTQSNWPQCQITNFEGNNKTTIAYTPKDRFVYEAHRYKDYINDPNLSTVGDNTYNFYLKNNSSYTLNNLTTYKIQSLLNNEHEVGDGSPTAFINLLKEIQSEINAAKIQEFIDFPSGTSTAYNVDWFQGRDMSHRIITNLVDREKGTTPTDIDTIDWFYSDFPWRYDPNNPNMFREQFYYVAVTFSKLNGAPSGADPCTCYIRYRFNVDTNRMKRVGTNYNFEFSFDIDKVECIWPSNYASYWTTYQSLFPFLQNFNYEGTTQYGEYIYDYTNWNTLTWTISRTVAEADFNTRFTSSTENLRYGGASVDGTSNYIDGTYYEEEYNDITYLRFPNARGTNLIGSFGDRLFEEYTLSINNNQLSLTTKTAYPNNLYITLPINDYGWYIYKNNENHLIGTVNLTLSGKTYDHGDNNVIHNWDFEYFTPNLSTTGSKSNLDKIFDEYNYYIYRYTGYGQTNEICLIRSFFANSDVDSEGENMFMIFGGHADYDSQQPQQYYEETTKAIVDRTKYYPSDQTTIGKYLYVTQADVNASPLYKYSTRTTTKTYTIPYDNNYIVDNTCDFYLDSGWVADMNVEDLVNKWNTYGQNGRNWKQYLWAAVIGYLTCGCDWKHRTDKGGMIIFNLGMDEINFYQYQSLDYIGGSVNTTNKEITIEMYGDGTFEPHHNIWYRTYVPLTEEIFVYSNDTSHIFNEVVYFNVDLISTYGVSSTIVSPLDSILVPNSQWTAWNNTVRITTYYYNQSIESYIAQIPNVTYGLSGIACNQYIDDSYVYYPYDVYTKNYFKPEEEIDLSSHSLLTFVPVNTETVWIYDNYIFDCIIPATVSGAYECETKELAQDTDTNVTVYIIKSSADEDYKLLRCGWQRTAYPDDIQLVEDDNNYFYLDDAYNYLSGYTAMNPVIIRQYSRYKNKYLDNLGWVYKKVENHFEPDDDEFNVTISGSLPIAAGRYNKPLSPATYNVGHNYVVGTKKLVYILNPDKYYYSHDLIYDYENLTVQNWVGAYRIPYDADEIGTDLLLSNINYHKSINDDININFSSIGCASIDADLYMRASQANALIGTNVVYVVDYGDGVWHNKGFYTIDDVEGFDGIYSHITGHDQLYKLNKYVDDFISEANYPITLQDFYESLLTYCGINYDTQMTILNGSNPISHKLSALKVTGIKLAQYIAQLAGGFFNINEDYECVVRHYTENTDVLSLSEYASITYSSYVVQKPNQIILGFQDSVKYSNTVTNPVPYWILDNPLVDIDITEQTANGIINNLVLNVLNRLPSYRSMNIQILCEPETEIHEGDILTVQTKYDAMLVMLVMDSHIDGSGLVINCYGEKTYPIESSDIGNLMTTKAYVNTEITDNEIIQELGNAVNDLSDDMVDLEDEMEDLSEEVGTYSGSISDLQSDVSDINDKDAQQDLDIGANTLNISNLSSTINGFGVTVASNLASIALNGTTNNIATKAYVDGEITSEDTLAQGYASTAETNAKTYADGVGTSTLASANAYTDSVVVSVGSTVLKLGTITYDVYVNNTYVSRTYSIFYIGLSNAQYGVMIPIDTLLGEEYFMYKIYNGSIFGAEYLGSSVQWVGLRNASISLIS